MRVNPNSDIQGPIGATPMKSKGKTATPQDNVDLAGSTELARALENVPVVRADKVAKAKALVEDSSYPNETALSRVAGVLANHIRTPESSE